MNNYTKHPVIIAGSRTFNDIKIAVKVLKDYCKERGLKPKDIQVVSGTANGADKIGEFIAEYYNMDIKRYEPNWDKFGQLAGFMRNEQMAQYTSKMNGGCLLFWDGESKGTLHMLEQCKEFSIDYVLINTQTYWDEVDKVDWVGARQGKKWRTASDRRKEKRNNDSKEKLEGI